MRVAGVDVGGRTAAQARALIAARAQDRGAGTVTILAADGPAGYRLDVPAATLAGPPRIAQAVAAARDARGPVGRALSRLGVLGDVDVPLRYALRDAAVTRLAARLRRDLAAPALSARVLVGRDRIVATPARDGRAVDAAALRDALATLPATLRVRVRRVAPRIGDAAARRARDLAARIVDTPHRVRLGRREAAIPADLLRRALRFDARHGGIDVALDAATLRRGLAAPLGAPETPPRDARLEVRGDRVVVVPSVPGRLLRTEPLADALVRDPGRATVEVAVAAAAPDLTTTEARALGIREEVGAFTTPYACCQPRVANIRRAAEILDGHVIPAGGTFSLNAALGERTSERGFVSAPTIQDGRLVDSTGGGVSQIATTLYNAAFLAGLDLVSHTPHQFYISRYPMGREATVSWPHPDLVLRNDWPAGILVDVTAADTSVTVRLYSSPLGRRVEATTGTPRGRREPTTRVVRNDDLPPGTRRVAQGRGPEGFTITYGRRVYRGDRLIRDESFTWSYDPEDEIVEVGPGVPLDAPPDPEAPPPA
ncbi:MAG: VanW family protein, partial [Actinomycetota bacterium]